MSRLPADRLFGHRMVASSKARRFGFRMEAFWGARQSRAERAARSLGETPEGSRTGCLFFSSAYRLPKREPLRKLGGSAPDPGAFSKARRFGFRMEAFWGARQSRADRAARPYRGVTPLTWHDDLVRKCSSQDFETLSLETLGRFIVRLVVNRKVTSIKKAAPAMTNKIQS